MQAIARLLFLIRHRDNEVAERLKKKKFCCFVQSGRPWRAGAQRRAEEPLIKTLCPA